MKYLISLLAIIVISFGSLSFHERLQTITKNDEVQGEFKVDEVPENVMGILDRSCLPCHGADGSGKAKMKWNWEKMNDYSKTKLISKLVKVAEKVDEGKMPPAKNVKKNPDRALSDDDKKALMEWADGLAEKTSGESE